MRRNRIDAAAALFFSAAFLAVIFVAVYYLVDVAVGAVD